ncbi:XdhC family protein [Pseudarthrobacter enclensis]|uniref:XdhC family protein n=1 Tax=Pseudarthrobacter enclensis TaxID=993070 RepID=UPI003429E15E
MLDLIPSLGAWLPALAGRPFAVATIVAAAGSVPRPVGTSMIVTVTGQVLGSLSGGCVEGAVVALAQDAMDDAGTRRETFGFSSADAFAAGLTCGGTLTVHIEPVPADDSAPLRRALHLLADCAPDQPVALVRRLDDRGSAAVVLADPATAGARSLAIDGVDGEGLRRVAALVRSGGAGVIGVALPGGCPADQDAAHTPDGAAAGAVLVESRLAPPRMLVFGANDFGAALVPAAKLLGYHVTLVDARPAFANQPRFGAADAVVTDWPHRYLAAEAAAGRLDSRTVAAVLTHDPKFDLPLLEAALAVDLAYVGAMGSRRSHLQRVDGLLAAGVRPERIAALHSPIGLDLGAVTPAEVAVSITAELIAARTRTATGTPLRDRPGPIHDHPAPDHGVPRYGTSPAPAPSDAQEIAWT